MPGKVLIIEDARSDREQFRKLLGNWGERVDFAWAWDQHSCSVHNWFRMRCKAAPPGPAEAPKGPGAALTALLKACDSSAIFGEYTLVLLDMAWSRPAEDVVRDVQFLRSVDGVRLAKARTAVVNGRGDVGGTDKFYNDFYGRLADCMEGVALLDWLEDVPLGPHHPEVWVTSAFVTTQARCLRNFLREAYGRRPDKELFHKWSDRERLADSLSLYLNH
jgi:hypothetical protein